VLIKLHSRSPRDWVRRSAESHATVKRIDQETEIE
jgi:hypothetical protein